MPTTHRDYDLISVVEAADLAKMTPSYIRRMLRTGRIEGVKMGTDWFTTREAIQDFLASDRKMGRPPKKDS